MTVETIRSFCRALPDVTEDVKWGSDLVFSIGSKMFAVVCLDPPHTVAFKCTPEAFAELVERDGIIPAPYLARAMWVQERAVGEALDRKELERLLRASYDLVLAKFPRRRQSKRKARSAKKPPHPVAGGSVKARSRSANRTPASQSSRHARAGGSRRKH